MDCSRQQTKQRFFPSCVSLAQSSCLYACWASRWCEVKMADKPPWRAAHHSIYYELRTKGTTQREIEQSCLIQIKMSLYPRPQELLLLQMPFLLYSCRLLTFENKDIGWVCNGVRGGRWGGIGSLCFVEGFSKFWVTDQLSLVSNLVFFVSIWDQIIQEKFSNTRGSQSWSPLTPPAWCSSEASGNSL